MLLLLIIFKKESDNMAYEFQEIEKKWQKYWDDKKTFITDVWDFSKPKYYA